MQIAQGEKLRAFSDDMILQTQLDLKMGKY